MCKFAQQTISFLKVWMLTWLPAGGFSIKWKKTSDFWSFQHLAQWSSSLLAALASLLVISEQNLGEWEWHSSTPVSGSQESEESVIEKLLFSVMWKGGEASYCSVFVWRLHCEAQGSLSVLCQGRWKGDNPFPLHLPLQGFKVSTSIQWSDLCSCLLISPHLSCLAFSFRDFSEVTIWFLSLFFTLTLLRLETINNSISFKVLEISEVNPPRQELCQAVLAHWSVSVVMKIFVCFVWFTLSSWQNTLWSCLWKL